MALEKDIEVTGMGIASYHRIVQPSFDYTPDPHLGGCVGTVMVAVASYLSQAAREAGAGPMTTHHVMFRFGAEVSDQIKGIPVAVISSDEPSREEIYLALNQSPIFEGAVEA